MSFDDKQNSLTEILEYLSSIQCGDGSFDTYYLQPEYFPDRGWHKFPGNAPYDTASTLVPLLQIDNPTSNEIIARAVEFLKSTSLDNFLWTYAHETEKYHIPYDTDTTSLVSLVLSETAKKPCNTSFLNSLVNDEDYYPFYVWLKSYNSKIPLLTLLKMLWRDRKVKRCIPIVHDDMRVTDAEFTSTCINLLYLGRSANNERVWQKIKQVVNSMDIDHMYYIDLYHSFYHFSRLIFYSGFSEILPISAVLNNYVAILVEGLREDSTSDRLVLFVNSMLFLRNHIKLDLSKYIWEVRDRINSKDYMKITAAYSSNVNTDHQSNGSPNTYFGSFGQSAASYLEFVCLIS